MKMLCLQKYFWGLLIGFFILLAIQIPALAMKIAFESSRDFGEFEFRYNIYVMDADGRNLVRLTQGPASDGSPAWSPDGTKIAFASNRNGRFDVYVMDANGGNPINLTQNPGKMVLTLSTSPKIKRQTIS